MTEQEIRHKMMVLQHEILKIEVEAKNIALKHLESTITSGDPSMVASLAAIINR